MCVLARLVHGSGGSLQGFPRRCFLAHGSAALRFFLFISGQTCLFFFGQVTIERNQLCNTGVYGVPPKQFFTAKSTIRKCNPFSIVTNKTAAAVQIGVGMTTDPVFIFQELNGALCARLRLIESVDAILAMGKPAS